jgi:hypothetical protein
MARWVLSGRMHAQHPLPGPCVAEDMDEALAKRGQVVTYQDQDQGMTTTVTTLALGMGSDSEGEQQVEEAGSDGEEPGPG